MFSHCFYPVFMCFLSVFETYLAWQLRAARKRAMGCFHLFSGVFDMFSSCFLLCFHHVFDTFSKCFLFVFSLFLTCFHVFSECFLDCIRPGSCVQPASVRRVVFTCFLECSTCFLHVFIFVFTMFLTRFPSVFYMFSYCFYHVFRCFLSVFWNGFFKGFLRFFLMFVHFLLPPRRVA